MADGAARPVTLPRPVMRACHRADARLSISAAKTPSSPPTRCCTSQFNGEVEATPIRHAYLAAENEGHRGRDHEPNDGGLLSGQDGPGLGIASPTGALRRGCPRVDGDAGQFRRKPSIPLRVLALFLQHSSFQQRRRQRKAKIGEPMPTGRLSIPLRSGSGRPRSLLAFCCVVSHFCRAAHALFTGIEVRAGRPATFEQRSFASVRWRRKAVLFYLSCVTGRLNTLTEGLLFQQADNSVVQSAAVSRVDLPARADGAR